MFNKFRPLYAEDGGQGGAAPEQGTTEPFHRFAFGDEEKVWNSPDELNEYIRQGTLRHQDYTRKTQTLADMRRQVETRQKEFEERERRLKDNESRYKQFNDFLTRRKDVADYIENQMRSPSTDHILEQTRGYADEKTEELKKEMEEFKEWKRQQEALQQRNDAFSQLKQLFPDFDEKTVSEKLDGIFTAPDGDEIRSLAELAYYAAKGQSSPAEIEQNLSAEIERKKGTKSIPSSSGEVQAGGQDQYADEAEAAEAAKKALGA